MTLPSGFHCFCSRSTLTCSSTSAPSTNKGASGDKKGFVYIANNYFYYCTADYDGTTNVWSRIAATDAW